MSIKKNTSYVRYWNIIVSEGLKFKSLFGKVVQEVMVIKVEGSPVQNFELCYLKKIVVCKFSNHILGACPEDNVYY